MEKKWRPAERADSEFLKPTTVAILQVFRHRLLSDVCDSAGTGTSTSELVVVLVLLVLLLVLPACRNSDSNSASK